jgi:adenylylsulfate kinase
MNNSNIIWHNTHITKEDRKILTKQRPTILWFTGLSGSGKSTIANAVEKKLFENGNFTYLLDGDNIRHGLNKDLGFDEKSRIENIRRIGEVAKLFVDSGLIVLSAFISPFAKDRQMVRDLVEEGEFIEIFVDTPIDECKKRDPKGLNKKALNGEIKNFTGIDSPYEKPDNPEIVLKPDTIENNLKIIIDYLIKNDYIKANNEN